MDCKLVLNLPDNERCYRKQHRVGVDGLCSIIQEAGGFQDQVFAATGGVQYIQFSNTGSTVSPVTLSSARTSELERSLVLVYSGTMRDGHAMAAKQLAVVEHNAELLCKLSELAAAARDLLADEHEPLATIGRLLAEAWGLKRALLTEISNPDIDTLYARGMSLGALGGKLCGAGGGGFLLFFVPLDQREHFDAHIGMPTVRFRITQQGSYVLVNEP